jgi:hypothetical protein
MGLDVNALQGLAYNLFAGKALIPEKSEEPIGKLCFGNREKAGVIHVKALDQGERALLQFTITGKVPEGYSEKSLKESYDNLKQRLQDNYSIIHSPNIFKSGIKWLQHRNEVVIKTDAIYQAITDKEQKLETVWSKFVEGSSLSGKVVDAAKSQFYASQRLTDLDQLVSRPVRLKNIYQDVVDEFLAKKGSYDPSFQTAFEPLDRLLPAQSKTSMDLKDTITEDAFKDAYSMSKTTALSVLNQDKGRGVIIYYDKDEKQFFIIQQRKNNLGLITQQLKPQERADLLRWGEQHVLDNLKLA